jgi:hypothetical protein
VLNHCDGNQSRAAAMLGIHRATLRKKLKDHGIAAERRRLPAHRHRCQASADGSARGGIAMRGDPAPRREAHARQVPGAGGRGGL